MVIVSSTSLALGADRDAAGGRRPDSIEAVQNNESRNGSTLPAVAPVLLHAMPLLLVTAWPVKLGCQAFAGRHAVPASRFYG